MQSPSGRGPPPILADRRRDCMGSMHRGVLRCGDAVRQICRSRSRRGVGCPLELSLRQLHPTQIDRQGDEAHQHRHDDDGVDCRDSPPLTAATQRLRCRTCSRHMLTLIPAGIRYFTRAGMRTLRIHTVVSRRSVVPVFVVERSSAAREDFQICSFKDSPLVS